MGVEKLVSLCIYKTKIILLSGPPDAVLRLGRLSVLGGFIFFKKSLISSSIIHCHMLSMFRDASKNNKELFKDTQKHE
jgi:hypothetical protein